MKLEKLKSNTIKKKKNCIVLQCNSLNDSYTIFFFFIALNKQANKQKQKNLI